MLVAAAPAGQTFFCTLYLCHLSLRVRRLDLLNTDSGFGAAIRAR
jgi:hypothetical protein